MRRRSRLRTPLVALLVLTGLFLAGFGLGQLTGTIPLPPSPALEPSWPVRISIPAIGVRAPVRRVGLAADGTVATPPPNRRNEAGWYDRGPTPGQFGPAIIVGHLDTRDGPAVFHRLSTLRPGQLVEVTRRDRRVVVFTVDSVETFDKARLPVERIYRDFSRPGLRLITCGGRWVGGDTGYADNVVIFASIKT
jgi:hypothetical protein